MNKKAKFSLRCIFKSKIFYDSIVILFFAVLIRILYSYGLADYSLELFGNEYAILIMIVSFACLMILFISLKKRGICKELNSRKKQKALEEKLAKQKKSKK